jgi:hypothetical protein
LCVMVRRFVSPPRRVIPPSRNRLRPDPAKAHAIRAEARPV